MSGASLTFSGVAKGYVSRDGSELLTALTEIDLEVPPGQFLGVLGPSGCGKSTLLDLAAGLAFPDEGKVLTGDSVVQGPGPDRAVVFQQYALLPWRTARRNIEFALEGRGLSRRERADRAAEYLELVGLTAFAEKYPHELSGGMRQRVAIARALSGEPETLLLDEPFAALDAQTREQLQDELLRIWRQTGKTVLFITHSIEEAVFLCQRVVVLTARPGRIKAVLEIDLGDRDEAADLRSTPRFAEYRHEIWTQLHDEVDRARRAEEAIPVG